MAGLAFGMIFLGLILSSLVYAFVLRDKFAPGLPGISGFSGKKSLSSLQGFDNPLSGT
jgi:hypothetical protein